MRILFISSIPPIPTWGSAMTFYRHFCERDDFTIAVITNDKQIKNFDVKYPYMLIDKGKLWKRVSQTRFSMLPHTWSVTGGSLFLPSDVVKYAKDFAPDAIFTMAGTWTWMAILAQQVSKKLNVPLIGSFNDWWYYNALYHKRFHNFIEGRFRKFYRSCDLALCTSEGMQRELGPHHNSVIVYPTGALLKNKQMSDKKSDSSFIVAFGGSLGEWYGKMMEALIIAAKGMGITFKLFGGNPSWSAEFDDYVKKANIYGGQISFEQLQKEMETVDGLLLFMGFDKHSEIIEATSFKTKFLDYLSFQKPILLWGPPYCTAAAIAKEFNSAEVCTSPDPKDFVDSILKLKDDRTLQQQLVLNATKMYEERFHPDKIHEILKKSILALKKQ